MKFIHIFIYIFGVISLSIFVHEGVHWIQYNTVEEKQIYFFDDNALEEGKIAYLDTKDEMLFLTNKEYTLRELEAWIFTLLTLIIGFSNLNYITS